MDMMAVIGMIVLLMGDPHAVDHPRRAPGAAHADAVDLQAISSAVDAYRKDHGDYPPGPLNWGWATNVTLPGADRPGPGRVRPRPIST